MTCTMPGSYWFVRRVDAHCCYETSGIIAVRRPLKPGDADSSPDESKSESFQSAYRSVMDLPWDGPPIGDFFPLPECPPRAMQECEQCGNGECGALQEGYECERREATVPVTIPVEDWAIRSDILRYLIALDAKDAVRIALPTDRKRKTFVAFRSAYPGGLAIWMPMRRDAQ